MSDLPRLALEATRRIRASPAWGRLGWGDRSLLDVDLGRIERALGWGEAGPRAAPTADPFAVALETPFDLQRGLGPGGATIEEAPGKPAVEPTSAVPERATGRIGRDTAEALDAIDFSGFVAGLISGTFQAIVRSTTDQMREFAALVASLSKSVDDFSRDNVNPNQVRVWLAERYPADLRIDAGRPGGNEAPKLLPTERAANTSPDWLERYGFVDQKLTAAFTDGELLSVGQRSVAEERMQQLATLVLMGVSRIVVDQGNIKARLQFHAKAEDRTEADVKALTASVSGGIAGQQPALGRGGSAMVSTVRANAQSEGSIRAELMGEVSIQFRTETFPLERFADSQAIELLNRHARYTPPAAPGAAAPAPATSLPSAARPAGSA